MAWVRLWWDKRCTGIFPIVYFGSSAPDFGIEVEGDAPEVQQIV
jgi:hypothetical protein